MSKIYSPDRRQAASISAAQIGLLVLALVIVLAVVFYWVSLVRARTATLEYVSGEVATAPSNTSEWQMVSGDIRVRAGQQIRVGHESVARLVFNDGSRIMLDAGARIKVEQISGNWVNSLYTVIVQEAGRTRHNVDSLSGPGSGYQVITPSGTAVVRGTSFSVTIDESGYTRFSVDKGKIAVQSGDSEVIVSSGQAVVARGGVLDNYAAFQFSLSGIPHAGTSGDWLVNGVSFLMNADTLIKEDPQVGAPVFVEGRILGGQWIADLIMPMPGREALSSFTGIFSRVEGETWVVGEEEITLSPEIDIIGKPAQGEALQVVFRAISDSQWVADVIIALGETGEVLQLFATPTNTLQPTYTPMPPDTQIPSVATSSIISTLPPTASRTVTQPSNPLFTARPPGTNQRPTATRTANPWINPGPVPTATSTNWIFPIATSTNWIFPTATPTVWNIFSTPTWTATWRPTATPSITNTPRPTSTPGPTNTPKPTKTPRPPKNVTPTPSFTPFWTATWTPTTPPTWTATPFPTNTPTDEPTATEAAPMDTAVPSDTPVSP